MTPRPLPAFALAAACAVVPGLSLANGCGSVDRDTADAAVAILERAGTVVHDDWFRPLAIERVAWVRSGFLYRVVVNGEVVLDLAYAFIPDADPGLYRSLGRMLDCGLDAGPRRIPRRPFREIEGAASRPDPQAASAPPRLVGLLELPALEAAWYDSTKEPPRRSVRVYEAPSADADLRAEIADMNALPYREYGYERPGAVVLEARPGWYRIALADSAGWIAAADSGRFHAVADLVRENLSYLAGDWDGRLWKAPGEVSVLQALDPEWRRKMGDEINVEVGATRRAGGRLWLEVALLWPGACGGEQSRVIASGWVPAFAPSGEPNVWFWSRGC